MTERKTILVVEDDQLVGQTLSITLNQSHYRVLLTDCGTGAIEIARLCPNGIDVIVADVSLGRDKGPVVAEHVRKFCPDARLLLMSGYPVEILYEKNLLQPEYLEDGQTVFLQKPFFSRTLVQTIDNLITRRSGEGQKYASANSTTRV